MKNSGENFREMQNFHENFRFFCAGYGKNKNYSIFGGFTHNPGKMKSLFWIFSKIFIKSPIVLDVNQF